MEHTTSTTSSTSTSHTDQPSSLDMDVRDTTILLACVTLFMLLGAVLIACRGVL